MGLPLIYISLSQVLQGKLKENKAQLHKKTGCILKNTAGFFMLILSDTTFILEKISILYFIDILVLFVQN